MNKSAFKKILDIVIDSEIAALKSDKPKEVFCYSEWFIDPKGKHKTVEAVMQHPCGTQGCIGGWAAILQLAKEDPKYRIATQNYPDTDSSFMFDKARKFLGITRSEAQYLFYGRWHGAELGASTRDVIDKLRNIIETGKVKNLEFDRNYQSS